MPPLRHSLVAVRRLLAAACALLVSVAAPAAFADDRVPTAWQEQAGTAPLLTAPPPANPATICVIDTGITPTPDLEITARRSLLGGTLDDIAALPGRPGHGTVVAHFAAGKVNGWGGAGAFPHARVTSVRIFPEGGGNAHWQDYLNALDHCSQLDPRTRVVVMSLGGSSIAPDEAAELSNRVEAMRLRRGWNIVAAAGNGGAETDFPGRFPAAFTVAGVSPGVTLCASTARGAGTDIAAPGCAIAGTAWDGSPWSLTGTSYAAPIVAGVLAALRSYRPDLGPTEAESVLLSTARPGQVPVLDASAGLRAVGLADLVESHSRARQQLGAGTLRPERVSPPEEPAGRTPEPVVGRACRSCRIAPAPRLSLRLVKRGLLRLRALNRPRGATVLIRLNGRTVRSSTATVVLRVGSARTLAVRFVSETAMSTWVKRKVPRRAGSR